MRTACRPTATRDLPIRRVSTTAMAMAQLPGAANMEYGQYGKNCWGVQRPRNFQVGVLPRDLMELYQLVLQMHQSQMQYFDATAEKI